MKINTQVYWQCPRLRASIVTIAVVSLLLAVVTQIPVFLMISGGVGLIWIFLLLFSLY